MDEVKEYNITEDQTGMRQWYECPKQHKVCALCLVNQSSRPVGEEQKQMIYPLYACLQCQSTKYEYATVHVHNNHCFDLFYVLLQYYHVKYNPRPEGLPDIRMLECMDVECQQQDKKQPFHPALVSLIEQYMPEYTIDIKKPLQPVEIIQLNNYLYRYLTVLLGQEQFENPMNKLQQSRLKLRGLFGCKENFISREFDKVEELLKAAMAGYPPGWQMDKNSIDQVFLKPMQATDVDWVAAAGLLAKCNPQGKLQEAYAIQNAKHWHLYAKTKAAFKVEKLLAAMVPLAATKENCGSFALPLLLPQVSIHGRAVLLTESPLGHKYASNVAGSYWSLYCLTALGKNGPAPVAKPYPPTNLAYENKFERYHQHEDKEDNMPMVAVYNLAQIYPRYLVRYTLP